MKTKALTRLRGCAGWSSPLLFAYDRNRFSHDGAQLIQHHFWKFYGFFFSASCHCDMNQRLSQNLEAIIKAMLIYVGQYISSLNHLSYTLLVPSSLDWQMCPVRRLRSRFQRLKECKTLYSSHVSLVNLFSKIWFCSGLTSCSSWCLVVVYPPWFSFFFHFEAGTLSRS